MPPLRIGVNALYLIPGGVGGTEIYLRNLLRGLAKVDVSNEYFVFTNRETGPDLVPSQVNFTHRPQNVRGENRAARLLWEQSRLPREAAVLRLDCLFNPGFTAPVFGPCPSVTVFHDLQHKRHPEHFKALDLPFWKLFLYAAVKRSAKLIAVSQATKDDLLRYYKLPADRVVVVGHGVESEFFHIGEQRGATEPLLLCVSTLHPHKNLERLIRVFAKFRGEHPEYRLVIAGMRGFHAEALDRLIAELQLSQAVRLTGWIEREELYNLFRRARAFMYPSTFEGFGMPVLEAMAARVPLACSSIEPLRSIVGHGAVLFDPGDDDGMLQAMKRVAGDEQGLAEMVQAGAQRAADFSWPECARQTLAVIEQAARKRSSGA